MLISLPSIPSIADIKSEIRSRPAKWGVIFVALLLALDLLNIATWMTFPALKAHKATVSTSAAGPNESSPGVSGLLDKLRGTGAEPSVASGFRVEREPFSVPGVLMTLQKDNVQVFEYPSQSAASRDAEEFMRSYDPKSNPMSWTPGAHLYVEGRLLVLYMGNRAEVISTLTSALGTPLATSS